MPFRLMGGSLAVTALVLAAAGCGSSSPSSTSSHGDPPPSAVRRAESRSVVLRVERTRALPAAVQLPGVARAGGSVLAAAGLDAADSSVADVVRLAPGTPQRVGTLPRAIHDVGATTLGSAMYVFGRGGASGPTRAVVRISS